MKKIINKPEDIVLEMCNGIVMANPELELINKYKVIKKKKIDENKVTLISGGGSGHEPAHGGFIGKGMLDAAICGDVFASPSQVQIYQGIKSTQSKNGTLLIIKNYSGDIMNFKNAAHMAQSEGIDVDYVVVDDDIAVNDSDYTVGRRGVAGTVFVHKIAGAGAEKGMSLGEVKKVAEKTVENVRSIGFALTSCTVPAKGTPTFHLDEDEMEYGVGIHGEHGIQTEKTISADQLAKRMTRDILKEIELEEEKDEIAILINGFGGSPLQELYVLNQSVIKELDRKGIKIARAFVGNYMTSIDMAGASLSILKLDDELKDLLSEESKAQGFMVSGDIEGVKYRSIENKEKDNKKVSYTVETEESASKIVGDKISLDNMIYIVDKMSEIIIENEQEFCELDAHAGDGDFGMSIGKGFRQLKKEWKEVLSKSEDNIGSFLHESSMIIMENCGGASGPIWGSAFYSAGKATEGKKELRTREFGEMLQGSVEGIQLTGERSFGRGAEIGDKTLIDALIPCTQVWLEESEKDIIEIFHEAAKAAVKGAKETEDIVARMGRAGTVGERSLGHPDAGAYALGHIFTEIAKSLK